MTLLTLRRSLRFSIVMSNVRSQATIDRSRVPPIVEKELEEQFVRGSGPGGQATNKTCNCVSLKHVPTGIVIKCHDTRSLPQNQKLARQRLQDKLDELINGEMSVKAQKHRIELKKSSVQAQKARRRSQMKKEFKEREGID